MAKILNTGRDKIALQQGSSLPLNVTKFVFANIPGLNTSGAVNLAQGMPAAGQIVHEQLKTKHGYVASDKVVYSIILSPEVGDFSFNWVGIVDADNTLIAVSYTPTQTKYKTVGLSVGNTLTRNFLLQFNDAQAVTAINIPVEAWQVDFIGRLNSIDESLRIDMRDFFGAGFFINSGFQIVAAGNVISAKAGVGYVGGYRVVLAADTVIATGVLPKDIYVDAVLNGDVSSSVVAATFKTSTAAVPLVDFTDGLGKKHYLIKLASVSAAYVVTDSRKFLPSSAALIDYLLAQLALKAPIASPAFTGTPSAPTAAAGADTTQVANAAFVQNALSGFLIKTTTGGTTTLTEAEASNPVIAINGAFTADVIIIMPSTVKRVWVIQNATSTTGFTLTVKTATNSGVTVAKGKRKIVYCNGINIETAFNDFDSIALSGISTTPTPATGNSSTQIANTEFVQTALAALIDASPNALNTLNELAAALGDDPNFSTTITNLLAAKAPNESPNFSGNPRVPTALPGDNDTTVANTAFVQAALAALVDSSPAALNTLKELATALGNDPNYSTTITNLLAAKAPLSSPAFLGTPTVPTAAAGTSTAQAASTAFVQAAITVINNLLAAKAPLVSPALTGTPTAPTAAAGNSSTQVATTAFVQAAITIINNLLAAKAPLASPAFTGTPTVPTAPSGDKSTQAASTEFVRNSVSGYNSYAIAGGTLTLTEAQVMLSAINFGGVLTSNAVIVIPITMTRMWTISNSTSGAFTLTIKTPTGGGVVLGQGKRNILVCDGTNIRTALTEFDSIALSGASTAPTPAAGNNSTQIANTAFVQAALAALIDSSPAALNTLNELAAALGDDPNFSTTITNLLAAKAPLASPAFSGTPTVPTAAAGTSTAQAASTAFVQAAITVINNLLAAKAPLASPALTGTPTAPTAAAGTNTTQVATTAFAQALADGLVSKSPGVTLVHSGAASSVGISDTGFYLVYTNAPSGANGWMGNPALVFKGPSTGTQSVFSANYENSYVVSLSGGILRAFGANRTTGVETALSINIVYKIG